MSLEDGNCQSQEMPTQLKQVIGGFTLSLVVFTGRRRTQHVLLDVSILHESDV
jgi:hypothetical protein